MNIFISLSRRILLVVAACLIAPTYAQAFSISLDSATGNYRIVYLSEELGREVQVVFEPPTKINPVVTPQVHFDGQFIYSYSLRNLPSAQQVLFAFDLPVVTTPTVVQSPQGWTATAPTPRSPFISWTSVDAGVAPSSQSGNFSIKSEDMPGIAILRLEGLADSIRFPDEPPADVEHATVELQREDRNSFVTIFSVGPSTFVYSHPGLAIDRLIAFKHEAVSLGWIFGPGSEGIVKSLDAKLDAAKASITRSQNKAAVNQLNAFINELLAQRDKHINDNAFLLLKTNAEFIIGKLGP